MPVTHIVPEDPLLLLERLGVDVVRVSSKEIYGRCPMHEQRTGKPDHNPGWRMNRTECVHHCWSCGYSGSFVSLVADLRECNPYQAIAWIRRQGLDLTVLDSLPTPRQVFVHEEPEVETIKEESEIERRFKQFVDPPVSAMLKRNLTAEAVNYFGIRWDPRQRGWVLPIKTAEGELIGYQFKRKKLVRNRPDEVPKSQTLFGFSELTSRRAILVESPLDVPKLWSDGIEGAVSSYGVYVSDYQMSLLHDAVDTLVLALDNDFAGITETRRLCTGVSFVERDGGKYEAVFSSNWARRMPIYVFNYGDSEGKDPGELSQAENQAGVNGAMHDLEWTRENATRVVGRSLRQTPRRHREAPNPLSRTHGRRWSPRQG